MNNFTRIKGYSMPTPYEILENAYFDYTFFVIKTNDVKIQTDLRQKWLQILSSNQKTEQDFLREFDEKYNIHLENSMQNCVTTL
jgi:hypothetical protein